MRTRVSAKPLFPAKVKPEVKMLPEVKVEEVRFEHRTAM
jgi:hypothetical protein